ncbi:hypothetical protein [Bradyrhizobium sp. 2TAF24]|uniref:hypothetical protein n=1 Tax=Bradyrhizobium sp. 2TAF24 TaxID=3233011 RepID=UPI003F90AF00
MAKWKGIVWLLGLAICFGAAKADDDSSLTAEARLLFQTVIADEIPLQRCELQPAWQSSPIPEPIARHYFGSTVRAELVPPVAGGSLSRIVDIAEREEYVCSGAKQKLLDHDRRRKFEAGSGDHLEIKHSGYTFPVFSNDYTLAALIVSHDLQEWVRSPGGVKNLPVQAVGYVAIYRKMDGRWRRVETIDLFVT